MIFRSNPDYGLLILRLTLGTVMFPHGAQKAIGAFEGAGFTKTMETMTGHFQMPYVVGLLVILAEFLGYGLGCDAHKMSIPHPEGVGGKIALLNALKNSTAKAAITAGKIMPTLTTG